MKVKIAVINVRPIQYFAPLYAHLNSLEGVQVTALYCTDENIRSRFDPGFGRQVQWDIDLLEGYEAIFLGGDRAKKRNSGGFFSLVCPEIIELLSENDFDVVWIHGHNYAVNLLAALAARLRGRQVWYRGETHLGLQRPTLQRLVRKPVLSVLFGLFSRVLAIGTDNRNFYKAMGVSEEKIGFVPYVVDNKRFQEKSSLTETERNEVRAGLGIHQKDATVIIFASKFIDRKRPMDLIKAFSNLTEVDSPVVLLMVGEGPLLDESKLLVQKLALERVLFAGFINQSELPRVFGASDVFVLPSEDEPWGLVINEAMNAGLPVVSTSGVGAVRDLVIDGEIVLFTTREILRNSQTASIS